MGELVGVVFGVVVGFVVEVVVGVVVGEVSEKYDGGDFEKNDEAFFVNSRWLKSCEAGLTSTTTTTSSSEVTSTTQRTSTEHPDHTITTSQPTSTVTAKTSSTVSTSSVDDQATTTPPTITTPTTTTTTATATTTKSLSYTALSHRVTSSCPPNIVVQEQNNTITVSNFLLNILGNTHFRWLPRIMALTRKTLSFPFSNGASSRTILLESLAFFCKVT